MYSLQHTEICSSNKKEPVNGYNTSFPTQPVGAVLLQIPDVQESSSDSGVNVIALPAFSQVNSTKIIKVLLHYIPVGLHNIAVASKSFQHLL